MSRAIAVLAFVLTIIVPQAASAASLTLVGASTKLCQLTGDIDWVTGASTASKTQTKSDMIAVDLGFPVDTSPGPLYFLFGDAFPLSHPVGDPSGPDDAFGWTTQTAAPTATGCIDLQFATPNFAHPVVAPAIKQGSFNVPTGGVFVNDTLYAFFWVNHCVAPDPVLPLPGTPLVRPAPGPYCAETTDLNSIGHSVFAHSTPATPAQFEQAVVLSPPPFPHKQFAAMPSGFVYVTAVRAPLPRIAPTKLPFPATLREEGVAIYGAARYRASIPYLAMASNADFPDPAKWRFYGGPNVWLTRAQWESGHNAAGDWVPPKGAEIYASNAKGAGRCVGEHQVTWNAPLQVWLLTYNCGVADIEARTAPEPWGPWSAPTVLIAKNTPNVYCTVMMSPSGCLGLFNYQYLLPAALQQGALYAPFVLNRYTQDATVGAGPRRATITWLLSPWNPYQVLVMQSTLEMTP